MQDSFHILNGDALKMQFPNSIPGDIIIARECLVDGNVDGENLELLFQNRAQFLATAYGDHSEVEYFEQSVPEFEKILALPNDAKIHLWFEDDLFCQVNFWFVMSLLEKNHGSVFLVRPNSNLQFGFGGMSESELVVALKNKVQIEGFEKKQLTQLWPFYQKNHFDKMIAIAKNLIGKFPFLLPAVNAHIDRFPKNGHAGRPTLSIQKIMAELQTNNFGKIFQEFSKRESIYGFGDLQVKRIFENIIKSQ